MDPAQSSATPPSSTASATARVLTQDTAWFRTPSGNIACTMDPKDGVRCDVRQPAFTPLPRPSSQTVA